MRCGNYRVKVKGQGWCKLTGVHVTKTSAVNCLKGKCVANLGEEVEQLRKQIKKLKER